MMKPLVSVVNAIPRLTAAPSPASTVRGVWVPKMLHGQVSEDWGVTGFEAAEAGPGSAEFVADTLKV